MAVLAKKCVPVASSWVHQFILTCDDKLAVQFKNGFCAYYLGSSLYHFQWALAAPSPGQFVLHHLYDMAYKPIKPPCPAQPCGGVSTNCCPSDDTPTTLHATITNGGACNGSYAITFDATGPNPGWKSTQAVGTCNTGTTIFFNCAAFTNLWDLTVGALPTSATSTSCSPFIVTFTGIDLTGCGGTNNATITVTA
jgi:hypothetical protein